MTLFDLVVRDGNITEAEYQQKRQGLLYQSQGGTYMDSHTSLCGFHLGISDHESVLHHHR
jgi:hypothetical protein